LFVPVKSFAASGVPEPDGAALAATWAASADFAVMGADSISMGVPFIIHVFSLLVVQLQ
jgi:hypothetical protein